MTLVCVVQIKVVMKMYSVGTRLCHILHKEQRSLTGPSSMDKD